jgi:hypothetical protein
VELVRSGSLTFFGSSWNIGPGIVLAHVTGNRLKIQFEEQKTRFITQCNLPKAEHFDPMTCSFCTAKDVWPFDYEAVVDHKGGVFMNFLNMIIDDIPNCRAMYNAEKAQEGKTEKDAVQSVLLPTLRQIVPIDDASMQLPIDEAIKLATSKDGGLTNEGLDVLGDHAIHAVLAIIVSGEEPGLGVNLSSFTSFEKFKEFISPNTVAKIIATFMKTGTTTLLYLMYLPLLKKNLIIIFVLFVYSIAPIFSPLLSSFVLLCCLTILLLRLGLSNSTQKMFTKENIPPDIEPFLEYFNIPTHVNDMDKLGLYDIEW